MSPYLTLHDPANAIAWYEEALWQKDTFYSLVEKHAEERPEATALRDATTRLSWQSLKARADAFADDLRDSDIEAGDRVSLWMSDKVEAVVAFVGCNREGVACNPSLHKSYTCGEIVDLLTELQASALVTEPGWGADRDSHDLEEMLADLGCLKKVYTPENFPSARFNLEPRAFGNPDAVAYLAFTSGTTGKPKCVMHSANTLMANARDMVRDWGLDSDDIILSLSPLSHHIAWVAISQWLLCGGEMVTGTPPEGSSRLDWIIETQASYVLGVPTHAMDILAEQRKREMERIGVVETFYMAGSPIPGVVAQAFVEQGIVPQNVYGMTECSSHQYTHPDDAPEVWVATCGKGGPAYEVKIWDPDNTGREMPRGETGEIGGRGACLMLGYFDNQRATETSFNKHGYFMSGDLGSFDEAGNLRIEGRAKDLIIRGGHNIYPSRIEALAHTCPAIEKAAAFGIPDPRLGEKVCLAVIGEIEADAMLLHLEQEGLSKFDMPEWFIALDDMPLTASGKILKRELAAQVAKGTIKPQPVRYEKKLEA